VYEQIQFVIDAMIFPYPQKRSFSTQ